MITGIKPYYSKDGITIYNLNCFLIMEQFAEKSFDAVITDPPYGITSCKWDTDISLEELWYCLKKLGKDNCAYVFTTAQPFTSKLVMSNLKCFRYEWIWEKERPTNIFSIKKQPGKVHENILVFSNKKETYNPIFEKSLQPNNNKKTNKSQSGKMNVIETLGDTFTEISKDYDNKKRYPRSVLKISRGTRNNKKFHPTQKPIKLMKYIVETYTNQSDIILDPFMGSGATLVAAKKMLRRAVGIEISEEYCEIAAKRLEMEIIDG